MICEKCGFEYNGEKCPVCEANVTDEKLAIAENKKSPLGIVGMILGIVGLAMFVLGFVGNAIAVLALSYLAFLVVPGQIIGLVPSIVGMVLSSVAKKKCPDDKIAKAGKILSLIGIIAKTVSIVVCIVWCVLVFVLAVVFGIAASFFPSSGVYFN